MTQFTIPGEPRGKGRPRFSRGGHAYTDERTRSYEQLVAMCFGQSGGTLAMGAVRVTINAYYGVAKTDSKRKRAEKLAGVLPPNKKPDIDNLVKIILDALNGVAYMDDAQVVALHAHKHWAEHGRVEVEIDEVQDEHV